jgi:hypothetical protein
MDSLLKSKKTASVAAAAAAAPAAPVAAEAALVSNQRWIILILSFILIISLLGASNAYYIIRDVFINLIKYITDFIIYISANLGYSSGTLLNTTTNVASNAAITSIEVADGAVNSFGDIFRDSNSTTVSPEVKRQMDQVVNESQDFLLLPRRREVGGEAPAPGPGPDGLRRDLDDVINRVKRLEGGEVSTDKSDSVIQNRTTAVDKNAWCLVGSLGEKRSCISVQPGDKCGYARLYDTRESCLQMTA